MAKLEYAEAGAGGRPFMLVHGFTGAKEDFTEWLDTFAAQGWHAVACDNRGHGASPKPDDEAEYSFDLMASDVLELASALWGDETPFVLLGHSMGGMVAQVSALRSPERIAALILMDTLPGPLPFIDRDMVDAAIHVVRARGIDGLHEVFADREGALETPAHRRVLDTRPGYQEFNDRKFLATSKSAYAAMLNAMFESPDRLESLKALTMPTLVLHGDQDAPFVKPSKRMAETIPDAELAIIPDAGHSPQFESPDAWWSAVSKFLARV